MKKHSTLFLLIASILLTNISFAQKQGQASIDSLLIELPKALPDTNKVKLLASLCFSYYPIDPDEGIKYGNEGLQLAEKLQYKTWIGKLNGNIGVNYAVKAEYPKALEHFFKAEKIGEELDDKPNLATLYGNIANIYFLLSNYPMAIEYDLKALKMNEAAENKRGIATNLSNIGLIYKDQSDYPRALEYFFKALKMNEEVGNKNNLGNNLSGIGIVYYKQENYEKALDYYSQAQRVYEEVGNKDGLAKCLQYTGVIYHEQSDQVKALDYNFKSLKLFKEVRNNVGTATTFSNIADAYLSVFKDRKNTLALQQAKLYSDSAITIQKEIEDVKGLSISYNSLSEIRALVGDFKGAYETHQLYKEMSDSAFNMEKDKKITQSAMQYDFDKKEALTKAAQEKKDALAKAELQQQKVIKYAGFGGLILVLLFAFGLYKRFVEKRKANIILEKALDDLKSTQAQLVQSEKMAAFGLMASRVAHEIQNPLNFVNNFSETSEELASEIIEAKNDEERKESAKLLVDNLQKIRHHGKKADNIVKQLLEHTRAGTAHEFFEGKQ